MAHAFPDRKETAFPHQRSYSVKVNEESPVTDSAEVDVPPWLGGGDPDGFFESSGLMAKRIGTSATRWLVSTKVSWDRARPILITVDDIAGPGCPHSRFDLLPFLSQAENPVVLPEQEVIEEVNRMGALSANSGDPIDNLAWVQLATMVIEASELREWLIQTYQNFIAIGTESDSNNKVFANAGVHIVRRAPELLHRIKLASVCLQLSSDSTFELKPLADIQREANNHGETVFASSEGLYDGIYTLDAYLAPLYGSLVPAVWAFPSTRTLGVIIYTFGQPLTGSRGRAAEMLHLLPNQGPTEASAIPSLTPLASSKAIRWWVTRLNELFAVLSDLTVFTDQANVYVPSYHLHAQLTVEQLFRRVFSIQYAFRDSRARQVLLFSALDTLEQLTARDIEVLCNIKHAKAILSKLKSVIPPEAAEVLLPGAERGTVALERLQDGFFIRRRTGADKIEWSDPELGPQELELDKATAHYIRLLRDATHGHGTKGPRRRQRTDALLTNHNGRIPHDLGWLAYLYLLDLLARPDDLRKRLRKSAKLYV